jgi:hexosaminidase
MVDGKAISNRSLKTFYLISNGKKITLTTQPSKTYKGDSAFTLVNGVQNEKGLQKAENFLVLWY